MAIVQVDVKVKRLDVAYFKAFQHKYQYVVWIASRCLTDKKIASFQLAFSRSLWVVCSWWEGKCKFELINNNLYVFGGLEMGSRSQSLLKFDAEKHRWYEYPILENSPEPRCSHSSWVIDNKLFIFRWRR